MFRRLSLHLVSKTYQTTLFNFQFITNLEFLKCINVLKIPAVNNDGAGAATVALIDFPEGQKERFPEGKTSACKAAISSGLAQQLS